MIVTIAKLYFPEDAAILVSLSWHLYCRSRQFVSGYYAVALVNLPWHYATVLVSLSWHYAAALVSLLWHIYRDSRQFALAFMPRPWLFLCSP